MLTFYNMTRHPKNYDPALLGINVALCYRNQNRHWNSNTSSKISYALVLQITIFFDGFLYFWPVTALFTSDFRCYTKNKTPTFQPSHCVSITSPNLAKMSKSTNRKRAVEVEWSKYSKGRTDAYVRFSIVRPLLVINDAIKQFDIHEKK